MYILVNFELVQITFKKMSLLVLNTQITNPVIVVNKMYIECLLIIIFKNLLNICVIIK